MERVTGIGGVFFKARDPAKLAAWYHEQLGVEFTSPGVAVFGPTGDTVWSPFPQETSYFGGERTFMVNYRVVNLDRMLAQLRAAGVPVDEKVDRSEYGNFGWATDPEGNRFELWEPPPK
jgi:predicted enzyme related to lactoylglutathione lyase